MIKLGEVTAQFNIGRIFGGLDFDNGHFIAELDGIKTVIGIMPNPQTGWYAGIDSVMICERYLEVGRPLTADECSSIIN